MVSNGRLGKGMNILTSNDNYEIVNEYETVYLINKNTNNKIIIADFYGDPISAIISLDEKYCVVIGCGLVVYFLKEPYQEYKYNLNTNQWKEWGRKDTENLIWIDSVKQKNSSIIEIETEDGHIIDLDIYNLNYDK